MRAAASFAHEMAIDPLGFAFGGVDPGTLHAHGKLVKVHGRRLSTYILSYLLTYLLTLGTLHAHGKLVKVHAVHYSVGLTGEYKLHVGLRQQSTPLPGSPFNLVVEPGEAYAASSKLPIGSLPLSGTASEEWQVS